jgi:hypothetical protein
MSNLTLSLLSNYSKIVEEYGMGSHEANLYFHSNCNDNEFCQLARLANQVKLLLDMDEYDLLSHVEKEAVLQN